MGEDRATVQTPKLTNQEIKRYSRHLIMPEVGLAGQEKLKAARVLCVGTGGLGSPLALYLASAGVGTLGIIDFDVVDFSNLHRQIIHSTPDVGRPKVESAREKLAALNPDITIRAYNERLTSENAMGIVADYDIVADGTDNYPTRYLVNDACVLSGKINVYGSIFRFEGQVSVFDAKRGPCYRCLFPEPPPPGLVPSCAEGGVLGILPGLVGVMQATEVVKLIIGKGEPLVGKLLLVNALEMKFETLKLRKNPECPICGKNPTVKKLIDYEQFCGIGRGQEAAGTVAAHESLTAKELNNELAKKRDVVLLDVREQNEWEICRLPEAKLFPKSEMAGRIHELDSAREYLVYCHHGIRSKDALEFLKQSGFKKVKHLAGGIHAWATDVDPSMPTY